MDQNIQFQIDGGEGVVEEVAALDMEALLRHVHAFLTDESADPDTSLPLAFTVKDCSSGLTYTFNTESIANDLDGDVVRLRQLENQINAGALTRGLSREDAEVINQTRRAILQHLEGQPVDFRLVVSELSQLLSRYNANAGFGHQTRDE